MTKPCKHEYENDNCTNCANGKSSSAYECAKTRGMLKEYCHDRAEAIHRDIYNKAINDLITELSKHSEYARPVGWSKKVEIITMSTVRDIAEQLKRGGGE